MASRSPRCYRNRMGSIRLGTRRRAALASALLAGALACSGASRDRPSRVALIGIDAANLDLVERLTEQGLLPHLGALMQRGSYGVLESLEPTESPVVWTSIVTGHTAEVHGIRSFRQPAPGSGELRLVNGAMRRVPALWSIASRNQRSVGFVGWWVSWPAEEVEGFIVSDHVAYTRHYFRARSGLADAVDYYRAARDTHPPDLREEIAPLIRHPLDIDPREIEALVPLRDEERAQLRDGELRSGNPFAILGLVWQQDATYRAITLDLLRTRGQPDLLGVLFRGTDPIGHLFWHFFEPEKARGVKPEEAERLGKLLPLYYARIDSFIGEILAALDPRTDILVVSDHGMGSSGRTDPGRRPRPGEHTMEGLWIAAGPHFRALGRAPRRSLLGVTPTVLRLLDIPNSADMPAEPFEDVLRVGWKPSTIATHGEPRDPVTAVADTDVDATVLEELRALGYIDEP